MCSFQTSLLYIDINGIASYHIAYKKYISYKLDIPPSPTVYGKEMTCTTEPLKGIDGRKNIFQCFLSQFFCWVIILYRNCGHQGAAINTQGSLFTFSFKIFTRRRVKALPTSWIQSTSGCPASTRGCPWSRSCTVNLNPWGNHWNSASSRWKHSLLKTHHYGTRSNL